MPVRLKPAAPQSRVKHSTTEPLRSTEACAVYSSIQNIKATEIAACRELYHR